MSRDQSFVGVAESVILFVACTWLACQAQTTIYLVAEIVWIDFVNINPHRTRDHAAILMLLSVPLAFFLTAFYVSIPLVAGIVVYSLGCFFVRPTPFWLVIPSGLSCVAVSIFLNRHDIAEEEMMGACLMAVRYFGVAVFAGWCGAQLYRRLVK